MGRRWLATDDFGPSDPLVKSGCSGTQMTSNGRSARTSVPWILAVAFILVHASHAISFPPASQLGQSSWCLDNGCAEQFEGLGSCVNLAAPLQISALSKRFDLSATSLKGLCGNVGCCHCMKLLPNSTEAATAVNKPSAKKPGVKKPKPKKPKAKKPKRPKNPKTKKPKTKKPKPKKPKSKTPKSKNTKPKIQNNKSQLKKIF